MTSDSTQQTMKAATAAKKLGIHLPAAPEEFRSRDVTRAELNDLLSAPPRTFFGRLEFPASA